MSLPLVMKKALITTTGIVVDEEIFTCPLAIKKQWFQKVLETGPIEVDFCMDPDNRNEGYLLLSVGYEWCQRVEHQRFGEEQMTAYFEQLEKMKRAYLQRKK
ncbi:hypothetical protein FHS18_000194 [Paenibacillus phyllosphaerae]|uniref:Uncharacterized protein n=1 Tax=Paenibacillus phyllosphaerae TaxID=274593 RepID=A0A7W5ATV4_9BACL|nr:hypothetical protein [Paenibacillus phyllosphaerae]MBB3108166.1 hypothetical protein [Paenibacillus phyllosphaerae]